MVFDSILRVFLSIQIKNHSSIVVILEYECIIVVILGNGYLIMIIFDQSWRGEQISVQRLLKFIEYTFLKSTVSLYKNPLYLLHRNSYSTQRCPVLAAPLFFSSTIMGATQLLSFFRIFLRFTFEIFYVFLVFSQNYP